MLKGQRPDRVAGARDDPPEVVDDVALRPGTTASSTSNGMSRRRYCQFPGLVQISRCSRSMRVGASSDFGEPDRGDVAGGRGAATRRRIARDAPVGVALQVAEGVVERPADPPQAGPSRRPAIPPAT